MKNRIAYVLLASVAKSLQSKVYKGQIDVAGMYAEATKDLVRKTIAKSGLR